MEQKGNGLLEPANADWSTLTYWQKMRLITQSLGGHKSPIDSSIGQRALAQIFMIVDLLAIAGITTYMWYTRQMVPRFVLLNLLLIFTVLIVGIMYEKAGRTVKEYHEGARDPAATSETKSKLTKSFRVIVVFSLCSLLEIILFFVEVGRMAHHV